MLLNSIFSIFATNTLSNFLSTTSPESHIHYDEMNKKRMRAQHNLSRELLSAYQFFR